MITKKTTAFMLVIGVLNLVFLHTAVLANSKEEKRTVKVKAAIAKLGVGNDSRVKVKLRDKTVINGYIAEITEDSFTVANEETNSRSTILYSQAKQVKGNNLSTGVKIAIGVGVILAIGIFYALLHPGD